MTKKIPAGFAASALGLLAISATSFAQEPPQNSPTVPAETSPAATAPNPAPAPDANGPNAAPAGAAACKGLAERPCRTNGVCTWIIPTEANKDGQIPPAYCRKLGPTKKKSEKLEAPPSNSTAPPVDAAPKE